MKHRVKLLLKGLSRLPEPEYAGQRWKVPMIPEMRATPCTGGETPDETFDVVTVVAEVWSEGSQRWLEWVIEI